MAFADNGNHSDADVAAALGDEDVEFDIEEELAKMAEAEDLEQASAAEWLEALEEHGLQKPVDPVPPPGGSGASSSKDAWHAPAVHPDLAPQEHLDLDAAVPPDLVPPVPLEAAEPPDPGLAAPLALDPAVPPEAEPEIAKTYGKAIAHSEFLVDIRREGDSVPLKNRPRFKHDTQRNILSAHCRLAAHGNMCRVNRSLILGKRNPNSCRPQGFELAWMACAAEYPDAQSHMASSRPPESFFNEHLSFERRKHFRLLLAELDPDISAAISELEGDRIPGSQGDDIEPEELP